MLIEILKPDFVFEDERGKLTQLVHDGYRQMNIIFSKKDVLRGNHYHKENRRTKAFCQRWKARGRISVSRGGYVSDSTVYNPQFLLHHGYMAGQHV